MDEVLKILGFKGALIFGFLENGRIEVLSGGKWVDLDISDFEGPANQIADFIYLLSGKPKPTITPPGN